MKDMFAQGGSGSAGIKTNKQAIARKFAVKQSEVVYFSVGVILSGYKVLYDKANQKTYSLPELPTGTTAVSLGIDGLLVHSGGTVDLGKLASDRKEYVTLPGSFTTGAVINAKNELLVDTTGRYRWEGALPKNVPEDSTPVTAGGIGDGLWKLVGEEAILSHLAESVGASLIGVAPLGSVQSMFYFVTPEQFGAIGDGTLHPLSELYSTLAEAQAEYPLATSLSQSIDWAAIQKADTVARSLKCGVRYPSQKTYYFSSLDTLMLDINSSHIGGPQSDHFCGTMIKKDKPAATGSTNIGDICIVKVKNTADTASTNGFVNGVVFQGFSLEWANVVWETPLQGDLSICLHMNDAIKAKVDVSVWGGEFGVYGYGCWGMRGTIRVLSCHKGIYFDPVASTPEHPTSVGTTGSTTSFDLRLEIGGTVYPIYLDKCQYSKFRGYIEVLEGTIWDSANETPVAIQLGRGCVGLKFELGMEFWKGVYFLADKDNKDIVIDPEFIYTYTYNDASGPRTARYTIANKYGQTGITIPSASRAIFAFNDIGNDIIVRNMYLSATATSFNNLESVDKYLYASLTGNRLFFDGGNVAPTSYLKVTRANKRVIDFSRNNGLSDALRPGINWYYAGDGMYEMAIWEQLTTDSSGAAWLNSPTGFNIQTVIAYPVGVGGLPHAMGITAVPTATTIRFVIDSGGNRNIAYKMKAELNN